MLLLGSILVHQSVAFAILLRLETGSSPDMCDESILKELQVVTNEKKDSIVCPLYVLLWLPSCGLGCVYVQ